MSLLRVLLLSLAVLALPLRGLALATMCPPTSPAQEHARASLVFTGIPLSVTRLDPGNPITAGEPSLVTFLVTAVWKGAVEDTIEVRTAVGTYETGKHYLLYASVTFAGFGHLPVRYGMVPVRADICSRGGLVEYALWDRYWLPEPAGFRPGPKAARVTLDDLFCALESTDPRTGYSATEALGHIIEARSLILPRLRRVVLGEAPGDPVLAMTAIGSMREAARSAEPELAWALRNSPGRERAAALGAMSTVVRADSFARYVSVALSDTSSELLAKACEVTGRLSRRNSAEEQAYFGRALVALIRHPVPSVRGEAVRALGNFRAAGRTVLDTINDLRKNDPDGWVRYCARVSWAALTGLDPWEGLPKGSRGAGDSSRQ